MTHELTFLLTLLFLVLFGVGTLLCLFLYKWNYIKFFNSPLWTKTSFWVPIFACLIVTLYLQNSATIPLTLALIVLAIREYRRLKHKKVSALIYLIVMCCLLAHLTLPFVIFGQTLAISFLVAVAFSSVLSDVFAYFFGNFFGKHKLPHTINPNKSWEGVFGQIIGAFCGYWLVLPLLPIALPITVAFIVGIASALGDIVNSIVKRQLAIKDWGMTIPGHGGVLDRFSSLATAIAACMWWAFLYYQY